MKKMPWVKWYPDQFLGGVAGMTVEEIGVYAFLLNMIYDRGGPVTVDFPRLAARVRMRLKPFMAVLASLQEQGKITVDGDKISNPRAETEIENRSKVLENWSRNLSANETSKTGKSNKNNKTDTPLGDPPGDPIGVENQTQKKERKKESMSSSPKRAKADREVYSEEFEQQIWAPYPRKAGTSKKGAWNQWRMLNDENQARVKKAIPLYAGMMRKEGRDDSKICHLEFFISRRIYETIAVTPAQAQASNVVQIPWWKTATRDQWERAMARYVANEDWRPAWGPAPGKDGCCLPAELIEKLPYHLKPADRHEVQQAAE